MAFLLNPKPLRFTHEIAAIVETIPPRLFKEIRENLFECILGDYLVRWGARKNCFTVLAYPSMKLLLVGLVDEGKEDSGDYWSGLLPEDVEKIRNILATEIAKLPPLTGEAQPTANRKLTLREALAGVQGIRFNDHLQSCSKQRGDYTR